MNHETIGVIGTTALAAAIAARLAGGRDGPRVIVHGLDADQMAAMEKRARVERAPNLFDLASECEVVIAAYDRHAALREALTGTADRPGLLGAFQPGSILCDFSLGTPDECARLAGQLAGGAIGYVEAAHIGSLESIREGCARIFAGGFGDHTGSLFVRMTKLGRYQRVGPQGHARIVVALIEAQAAVHAALEAELTGIGRAYGLELNMLAEALAERLTPDGVVAHDAAALAYARTVDVPILSTMKIASSSDSLT